MGGDRVHHLTETPHTSFHVDRERNFLPRVEGGKELLGSIERSVGAAVQVILKSLPGPASNP